LFDNTHFDSCSSYYIALREAIYQITTAFNEFAEGFQVDDKYKQKWSKFLNYQE
jgi:hypothetical protein